MIVEVVSLFGNHFISVALITGTFSLSLLMNTNRKISLVAMCVVAIVLFNTPFLSIFNKPTFIGSIPVFYGFLFGAWLVIIGATAWLLRQSEAEDE